MLTITLIIVLKLLLLFSSEELQFVAYDSVTSTVTKEGNFIRWEYPHGGGYTGFLGVLEIVACFESFSFTVKSQNSTTLIFSVYDVDETAWMYLIPLEANVWKSVKVHPEDMVYADSGPVKTKMDNKILFEYPIFLDFENILYTDGVYNNMTFVNNATFEYGMNVIEGGLDLTGGTIMNITENTKINGNVNVEEGSFLNVNCSRFEIDGDIVITDSNFTLSDGVWVIPQAHNYVHGFTFSNSYVNWVNGYWILSYPAGLTMLGNVDVIIKNVDMVNGLFTAGSFLEINNNNIEFINSHHIAEIILPDYNSMLVDRSEGILCWLRINRIIEEPISFPSASSDFSTSDFPGWDIIKLDVIQPIDQLYGLIIDELGAAKVENSELRAVGLTVASGSMFLKDFVNGESFEDKRIYVGDFLKAHFVSTQVQTWNFYALGDTTVSLVVKNSVFGEIVNYGFSRAYITNSSCDGSGGYLGARDSTKLMVEDSTINSKVICHDDAFCQFINCVINGDINVEDGIVMLNNTIHNGPKLISGSGKFIIGGYDSSADPFNDCSVTCLNDGECLVDVCDCVGTGFHGDTCNLLNCVLECQNGGICGDGFCNCTNSGFIGEDCSESLSSSQIISVSKNLLFLLVMLITLY